MGKQERQMDLLRVIVQEYIKSAKPVGSKTLSQEYDFDYSPATIRSDMAALEEAGYITQPHTSAGRVPTEKGYQFYIERYMHGNGKALSTRHRRTLDSAFDQIDRLGSMVQAQQQVMKQMVRAISELTQNTVVARNEEDGSYYTGLSHLFRQPEFTEQNDMMMQLGDALDHVDEIMQTVDAPKEGVEVLLGSDNPFLQEGSMIVTRYEMPDGRQSVVGIIGPMRMDYDTNISVMRYLESLMSDDNESKER